MSIIDVTNIWMVFLWSL